MTEVQVIRKDEFGETTKTFTFSNNCPYERLVAGEVVEVEIDEKGTLRDYVVESLNWNFTHFGNVIVLHIQPQCPIPTNVHLPYIHTLILLLFIYLNVILDLPIFI